jgi:hypothetical protein
LRAASGAASGFQLGAMTGVPHLAGVGAVIGGIGGLFGGGGRDDSKDHLPRKRAKKTAKKINQYNDKLDKVEASNRELIRDHTFKTRIEDWKRGKEVQDFQYAQALKQYQKSQTLGKQQFALNGLSAQQAITSELGSLEDMFLKQQFESETALSELNDVYIEQGFNKKELGLQLQGIRSQRSLGTAAIQNNINQLMTESSLSKESALIDGLVAQGTASLGQAGKSRAKTEQSTLANLQRGIVSLSTELTGKRQAAAIELAKLNAETSLAETGVGLNIEKINNAIANAEAEAEYNGKVMEANMDSFINQAELNLEDIALRKQYADLNVKSSMMLKPKKLAYSPKPEMPPERVFIDRMKVKPGATPSAPQQNIYAPLLQGVGNAASALASIDFG